jgi:outer membrane protein assembly factor BamD (BamD/ComL family)
VNPPRYTTPRAAVVLFVVLCTCLAFTATSFAADKPPSGPIATVLRNTSVFVQADTGSQRLDTITAGREMVIVEQNGPWVRVFANTDVQQNQAADAPVFGGESSTPPISGWVQGKGIVSATTPNAENILYGAAAGEETKASDVHGSRAAAQAARLLYARDAQLFPTGPHAGEAAWRAADIRWQIEKADVYSRPSAHEKEAYLRQQIDDSEMKKIIKHFPGSKFADLAAYDMLDNKVCGDWQGSTKCPEKEAELFQKYADEHPNSPKAPEALFESVYRLAAAGDIYAGDNNDKKAAEDREHAKVVATRLQQKYPGSDYSARAATLVYQMEQSIPIYGAERD